MPQPRLTAVVTGASRGIGLELCRQLLGRGATVHALARDPSSSSGLNELLRTHPERLVTHVCDVTREAEIDALAAKLRGPVDLLVNNAGIGGDSSGSGQTLEVDAIARVFDVNTLGPLRMVRALLPRLREAKGAKILNLSSRMGSLSEASGGYFPYRISKAALNMATKLLASELRGDGITVLVAHPGWVQTDMGGRSAPVAPEDSVSGLLSLVERAGLKESGGFFNFTGEKLPW